MQNMQSFAHTKTLPTGNRLRDMEAHVMKPDLLFTEGEAYYLAGNYAAAFPLLKIAADSAHFDAAYYVGLAYTNGFGCAPDAALALRYLAIASHNGTHLAEAGFAYAEAAEFGRGMAPNPETAGFRYLDAAKNGSVPAMFHLGEINETGLGTGRFMQDTLAALAWYLKAATHQHPQARAAIKRVAATL